MSVSDKSIITHDDAVREERKDSSPNPLSVSPGRHERALGITGPELEAEDLEGERPKRADGRIELTEDDAYDKLGYSFPAWKKWMILVVILLIQTSVRSFLCRISTC